MKKTHQGPFTPKQENVDRIKLLHIKCGFLDTEHLFMLPKNLVRIPTILRKLMLIFCKIYIIPTLRKKLFLLRNISRVRIQKSTVFVIIFIVFMWPLLLMNAEQIYIIHLQCLELLNKKIQDHLIKAR